MSNAQQRTAQVQRKAEAAEQRRREAQERIADRARAQAEDRLRAAFYATLTRMISDSIHLLGEERAWELHDQAVEEIKRQMGVLKIQALTGDQ